MFPMSKREKQGKTWVSILLLVPLVLTGITSLWGLYTDVFSGLDASMLIFLGILYALMGLISFAAYHGQRWARVLLLIIGLTTLSTLVWNSMQFYAVRFLPLAEVVELISSFTFYTLPPILLYLPAPNAFLRYQREKKSRHLAVLEHQLNQIGRNE